MNINPVDSFNNYVWLPINKILEALIQKIHALATAIIGKFKSFYEKPPLPVKEAVIAAPQDSSERIHNLFRELKRTPSPELIDQLINLLDSDKDIVNKKFEWSNGGNLLHVLAKIGRPVELIAPLAARGISLNERDTFKKGNTPLLWAVANANNEMAIALLDYEQDLDALNDHAALHLAVAKGYRGRSSDGEPLTVSNPEIVRKLVKKGANINLQDINGNTALHLAYVRRDREMIGALKGADESIMNKRGEKPKDMLNKTYKQALSVLSETTPAFILDQKGFEG